MLFQFLTNALPALKLGSRSCWSQQLHSEPSVFSFFKESDPDDAEAGPERRLQPHPGLQRRRESPTDWTGEKTSRLLLLENKCSS